MSKTRRKTPRGRPVEPGNRRALLVAVMLAVTVAIAGAFTLIRAGGQRGAASLAMSPAAVPLATDSGFGRLNGRWLRPDGGYVLEIRSVEAGGAVNAVYLNPRPINIARAQATRDDSTMKLLVELRAPGYPGSTYTLTYDQQRDQLSGAYFQAAMGQSFEVVFVRMR
jgi:hypothetical protein